MYQLYSFFLVFLFTLPALFAQSFRPEVISSAVDISEGTTVTLCWTLGEAVTETVESSNLKVILTQGFWQPEIHTTGIDKLSDLSRLIDLRVFPNPVSDVIFIKGKLDKPEEVEIIFFDSQGRELMQHNQTLMNGNRIQIQVASYAQGTYFLVVRALLLQAQSSFSVIKR